MIDCSEYSLLLVVLLLAFFYIEEPDISFDDMTGDPLLYSGFKEVTEDCCLGDEDDGCKWCDEVSVGVMELRCGGKWGYY